MEKFYDLLKKTGGVALLAAATYLGETGKDGGLIRDVWAAAKTAGTFGCLFATLAWLNEKRASQKAQEELLERTISFVESSNAQSRALEKIVEAVKHIGDVITNRLSQQATGGGRARRGR